MKRSKFSAPRLELAIDDRQVYGILMALICSIVMISNLAAVKIIPFFIAGLPVDAGIYLFPLSFIMIDVFNDRYGLKNANCVTIVAMIVNLAMTLYLMLAAVFPAYEGWEGQEAFLSVHGSTLRIVIASTLAFSVHFVDNIIFGKLRDGGKDFFLASIVSTVFAQVLDTLIFEFVAYLGVLSTEKFFAQFGFALVAALVVDLVLTAIISLVRVALRKFEERSAT